MLNQRLYEGSLCSPRTGLSDCLCFSEAYYVEQVAACIGKCPNATKELDLNGETFHDNCSVIGVTAALSPEDFVAAGHGELSTSTTTPSTTFDLSTVPTSFSTTHFLCEPTGTAICSAYVINDSTTGYVPVYTPSTSGVVGDETVSITDSSTTIIQTPITGAPTVYSGTSTLPLISSSSASAGSSTTSESVSSGNAANPALALYVYAMIISAGLLLTT